MHIETVKNPVTGRDNRMKVWTIRGRTIVDALLSDNPPTAKDISWSLLSDDGCYEEMLATEYGDTSESNFALSIFEDALDWTLGLAVIGFVRDCIQEWKKYPKTFDVLVNHKGQVFIRYKSRGAPTLITWFKG